ncbi:MAG: hypothetical protein A3A86_00150 [Elusimicrobia bacterium RIFCSPLOWO2_01_FULL_60_11]|nr:MAG: hypothetical protein A3A86_00150 [Elusimicrobia bacterium RIFCSPLOWO2_01_FULL_60_11]
MPQRFKCVLFDLDGTLLSTGGAGIRALEKAFFELHGLARAMEGVEAAGKTDPAIIREIFTVKLGRDCGADSMSAAQERYLSHLESECARAEDYFVMRGIPEVLERLKALETVIGLGTGNLERGARKKLHRSGLNPYFSFGGFGSDSEDRAEILREGHRKAQDAGGRAIAAEDVLIVGDTARDIAAARVAGFSVVAAATGSSTSAVLRRHKPDFLLENFEDAGRFVRIILEGAG